MSELLSPLLEEELFAFVENSLTEEVFNYA